MKFITEPAKVVTRVLGDLPPGTVFYYTYEDGSVPGLVEEYRVGYRMVIDNSHIDYCSGVGGPLRVLSVDLKCGTIGWDKRETDVAVYDCTMTLRRIP